jgi:predicted pyridoxine 5'-phosphate oxidase superfamily flavin-nucleotide-binding protein
MFQKGDVLHLEALKKMQELMKTLEEMKAWMEAKRKEFDALEDL